RRLSPEGERSLVRRLKAREERALAELYDALGPWVLGLGWRILGDEAEAEEVVADVFAQVWRRIDRHDARRGALVPWVLSIARNRALDALGRGAGGRGGRGRPGAGPARGGGARVAAPPRGACRAGSAPRGAAARGAARVLRGAVAQRDRAAAGRAAGHGQDAAADRPAQAERAAATPQGLAGMTDWLGMAASPRIPPPELKARALARAFA